MKQKSLKLITRNNNFEIIYHSWLCTSKCLVKGPQLEKIDQLEQLFYYMRIQYHPNLVNIYLKLSKLGELSYEIFELSEIGELSFGVFKLDE